MSDLGLVETKQFTYEKLRLESGEDLAPVTLAYETYGTLNEKHDNTILIFHALSGDAHVAGRHKPTDKHPGWWDILVGPGKIFDTNKYFILCANTIGGCRGSSGPSSINPKTKQPYGLDFPSITIKDMVNAQIHLLDHLGIPSVFAAIGGSMGGMLALQFAVSYPERVRNIIAMATSARVSAQGIAFNEVGRRAILHDPNWADGDYYGKTPPNEGLAIARMIGHITYLSDESMRQKFGRKLIGRKFAAEKFVDPQFEVENYLLYKGTAFTERFDANSYLYITKAIDLFNLADEGGGALDRALAKCKSRFLIVHFTSDWLYPEYQALEIVNALKNNAANASYRVIESGYGHDAFLLKNAALEEALKSFLEGARRNGH